MHRYVLLYDLNGNMALLRLAPTAHVPPARLVGYFAACKEALASYRNKVSVRAHFSKTSVGTFTQSEIELQGQ